MDDWDGFYTLAASTAGTLIGLIFVVITLGIEHTEEGDEHRIRLFVTPVLVYFTSLSLVMVPPLSAAAIVIGQWPRSRLRHDLCCCRASIEGQRIIWHVVARPYM